MNSEVVAVLCLLLSMGVVSSFLITSCGSYVCVHGLCHQFTGGHRICVCNDGWKGVNCSSPVSPATSAAQITFSKPTTKKQTSRTTRQSEQTTTLVHAYWLPYHEVSACSVTCGIGYIELKRNCSTGNIHDCIGSSYDEQKCSLPKC